MKIEPDVWVDMLQRASYALAAVSGYFGMTLQEAWWLGSLLLGIATYLTSLYFQWRKDAREEREARFRRRSSDV